MINMINARPIDEILDYISQDRAENTKEWYQVLIAFKNSGGSYDRFEEWSLYGDYASNYSQIKRAWDNVNANYSIGTLIYFAKQDSPDFDATSFSNIESNFSRTEVVPPEASGGQASGTIIKRPEPLVKNPKTAFNRLIKDYLGTTEKELRSKSPLAIDWSDEFQQDAIQLLSHCYAVDDPVYIGNIGPNYPWQICRSAKSLSTREQEQQNQLREEYKLQYQKDHLRPAGQWINDFNGKQAWSVLLNPHIRPNSLSGEVAAISEGKQSYVAKACVQKFLFTVVEFDKRPLSEQIAFWLAMVDFELPVAAIIHSGNKSLHGWLKVDCYDQDDWREGVENKLFQQYLEPIGADGQCKNPDRMSRFPGHLRLETGQRQHLLYLNPTILTND